MPECLVASDRCDKSHVRRERDRLQQLVMHGNAQVGPRAVLVAVVDFREMRTLAPVTRLDVAGTPAVIITRSVGL